MYVSEIRIPRDVKKIECSPRIKLEFESIRVGGGRRGRGSAVHIGNIMHFPATKKEPGRKNGDVARYLVGGYLLAPHEDPLSCMTHPDRVLVLCHIDSGLGTLGNVWINARSGAHALASGFSYRNPLLDSYASNGKVATILAILMPGQQLVWKRTGRSVATIEAAITYQGRGQFDYGLPDQVRKTG